MPTPEPFAVAEGLQVLACDGKAWHRGVRPGLSVPAAQALSQRLIVRPRDAAAETEALLGLAAWARQFTPAVALEFPDMLLLEIGGSLKLLGGLPAIEARLQRELEAMGFSIRFACAPTARAAGWMAIAANTSNAGSCTPESLAATVAALPTTVLPPVAQEGLQAAGAATLGEVLALPRDGLARRFGQSLLDELDRALGRLPEARSFFQPPRRFHAGIELPMEVHQAQALLFAGRRLLLQLTGYLGACACGVQSLDIRLTHRQSATTLTLGLLAPSRDAGHLTLLLRERLDRLVLGEAVQALSVTAEDLLPLPGENAPLFAGDAAIPGTHSEAAWQQLVDRLRSRLGRQAVSGLAPAADHRPEHGSIASEPGTRQLPLQFNERPFWLLPVPRPLSEIDATPHCDGPLELLAGPERIESGWWDGEEALRDYFIARSPHRSLLWIYRERHPARLGQWYLHGLFA